MKEIFYFFFIFKLNIHYIIFQANEFEYMDYKIIFIIIYLFKMINEILEKNFF